MNVHPSCVSRCTAFPKSFTANAGGADFVIPDAANLTQSFAAGNISASATVNIVDAFVSAVYRSGSGRDDDPFGCDANGLATLGNCAARAADDARPRSLRADGAVVRAVALPGAFVPATWATGGRVLSTDEVGEFYSSDDFREMADLGVNTVQIPVPCGAFSAEDDVVDTLWKLLERADEAGLSAILALEMPEGTHLHLKRATGFATDASNVIAIQLPSADPNLLRAVRAVNGVVNVLVPTTKGELQSLSFPPDKHLFAALDVGASTSVADVASSDSEGDRMKMFYRKFPRVLPEPLFVASSLLTAMTYSVLDESIACIDRSPIEWLDCFKDMPVYVTSGFDLAIDDCIYQDTRDFKDYGQCDRFDETIASGWWKRHRLSLASRQMFAYSKGLGFAFSAWKLYGEDDDAVGVIDTPAKLLSLRDVAAAGLLPPLSSASDASTTGAACLNGPEPYFAMGDATLAPTPALHDCGNGWWNATTEQCDYWVPPPRAPTPTNNMNLVEGAAGGAAVALVLAWIVKKVARKQEGYKTLP